jgi:hypothetical protein
MRRYTNDIHKVKVIGQNDENFLSACNYRLSMLMSSKPCIQWSESQRKNVIKTLMTSFSDDTAGNLSVQCFPRFSLFIFASIMLQLKDDKRMSLSEKQVFLTLMDKKYNSFRVPPSVGWN